MSIMTFSPFGYDGSLVTVEVDLRRRIPAVDIVGLADNRVKESRERMRAAIRNSGFEFPPERVLISLSPADLKKEGAGYDLPLALSVLAAKEDFPRSQDSQVLVMGELKLNGNVIDVRGIHAALQTAQDCGIKYAILPKGCKFHTPIHTPIHIEFVSNLEEAYNALMKIEENNVYGSDFEEQKLENKADFEDMEGTSLDNIEGHNGLKFAMAVAIAGRHHLLAWGAPGCGKTMVLQHLPELTPKLLADETPSTTRIWSLAGLMKPDEEYLTRRPFRMPHQTASIEGICGGGASCRPGEISLAHNGTLFLDEAAEFKSSVLQMLRVPLESHSITLCRAGRSTVFPAKFQLIMTTNPCPCGNHGNKNKVCLCSEISVQQYWKKFSAPLLDRMTIRFDAENEEDTTYTFKVKELRKMIKTAFEAQIKRGVFNQYISPEELDKYVVLDKKANDYLINESMKRELSPRAVANIKKLARTIADMGGNENVSLDDIKLAVRLFSTTPDQM